MSPRRWFAFLVVFALVVAAEAAGATSALRDDPTPATPPKLAERDARAATLAYRYLSQEAIKVVDRKALLDGAWNYARVSTRLTDDATERSTATSANDAIRADLEYLVEHNKSRLSSRLVVEAYVTGMANAADDPHTSYIPSNVLRTIRGAETEASDQLYFGFSAVEEGDNQRVWDVVPGSPAARAGLKAGDLILTTETASPGKDSPETNRDLSQALTVKRDGRTFRLIIRPEFASVPVAVTRSLGDDIDYLRVYSFNVGETDFREGLDPVWDQLQGSRLVLDLRGNPGGAITNLAELAGKLGYRGAFLTMVNRDGSRRRVDPQRSATFAYRPEEIAVLVDSSTFSAGEILASILQQAGSTVLGTQTKGYAHGALVVAVGDGALQIGLYRNLAGIEMRDIEGTGVTPDEAVPLDYQRIKKGDDSVIARAIELLSGSGGR
ncbi:MAG: S41 family peptidase [Dehalococcoidia bacterium]